MLKGFTAIRQQGEKIAALSEKTFEKVKRVRVGENFIFSSRKMGLHMILFWKVHVGFGASKGMCTKPWTL